MTRVVQDVPALRGALLPARTDGQCIGLVPTMGALHEGHLSLVRRARAECDVVVVSVFVNPLQFGAGEDFDTYPRDLEADVRRLGRQAEVVFAPQPAQFTPPGARTTVHVADLTERLEGATRPGHFDGVATIVTKLFNAVAPRRAYFGEKDFQQLAVIRQLVRDLDIPVEIRACPIVREDDGLALSSRNAYLSGQGREAAASLSRGLFSAARAWDGDVAAARRRVQEAILAAGSDVRADYVEVVDPATLEPLEGVVRTPARLLVAAHVGTTRLIDNIRLDPPDGQERQAERHAT